MEIVFRQPSPSEVAQPTAGDLFICFAHSESARESGLAQRVVSDGLSAFAQGEGPIERIVVSPDPTLDDLLAAEFSRLLLTGQQLPTAAPAFADYAYAVRRGYRADPDGVPLDASLEGIFQALRRNAGSDLSARQVGERFIARWGLVAERIMAAAKDGVDPTTTALRIAGSEFAQERDSLRRDRDVFRSDVLAGAQWTVKIPTESGVAGGFGLLLRDPKSKFFKYFSREAQQHLHDRPYSLLAVKEGPNRWTFSTDPTMGLKLKGLQSDLQAAEATCDPQRAARDPWYDGARHDYTIVGSPKGGTSLSEKEVFKVLRQWALVQTRRPKRTGKLATACVLSTMLASALLFWQLQRQSPSERPMRSAAHEQGGKLVERTLPLHQDNKIVRIEHGKPSSTAFAPYNPSKSAQPVALTIHLSPGAESEAPGDATVDISVNGENLDFNPSHRTIKDGELVVDRLRSTFVPGKNSVIITAADSAGRAQTWTVTLQWSLDINRLPNLYVLTIGISDYKVPSHRLHYASDDATSLAAAFAGDEGLLFGKVKVRRLLNDEAQRAQIISALFELQEATQDDLVIVCVSGHGAKGNGDRFYLLPWEWDCQEVEQYNARLVTSAVSWEEDFLAPLGALPCQVLVVLDTCHSGAAAGTRGSEVEEYKNAIQEAIQRKRRSTPGMVVLAACLPDQEAAENRQWGHGVCTLALLEAMEGKAQAGLQPTQPLPGGGVVSLQDLNGYVSGRVRDLTGGRQAVVTKAFRAISLEDIPITVRALPASLSTAGQPDKSIR